MTSIEEILLRMGFDGAAVQRGTEAMLAVQKRASESYVVFWKKAIYEKEQAEISADKASDVRAATRANRARELVRQRAQERQEDIRAQEAADLQADIRAASRANRARALLRHRGATQAGRDAATAAEYNTMNMPEWMLAGSGTASAMKDLESSAHGSSGALREFMVLIREMSRGNWSRVPGSLSLLLQYLKIPLGGIGIGAAAIGAGAIAQQAIKTGAAADVESQSMRNLQMSSNKVANSLWMKIADLNEAGKISDEEARKYQNMLVGSPNYETIKAIQTRISPLIPKAKTEEQMRTDKEMTELDDQHQRFVTGQMREQGGLQAELNGHLFDRLLIQRAMNEMTKDSLGYKQKQSELDKLDIQIQDKQKQIAEDKARAQKELNSSATDLANKISSGQSVIANLGAEYPTLENLAGRRWLKSFSAQYGARGRFDIGMGDGPGGDDARDYFSAKYQQVWDRTYGNKADAEADRIRMIGARDRLISGGFATPEMTMQKLQENTAAMKDHLQKLIVGGAVIKTKITETED